MLSVKGKRFKIFFFVIYVTDRTRTLNTVWKQIHIKCHEYSILQTNSEISIDFCNLIITYFAEYSVFRLKYSMEKQHKKPQVHSEEYKNLQLLIVTILSYFANSVSSTTFWDTCADPDVFPGGWRVCEIFLFARKFRGPFW